MPPTPRLDTPIASPTGGTTAPTAIATEINPSRRHSPAAISHRLTPLRSSAIAPPPRRTLACPRGTPGLDGAHEQITRVLVDRDPPAVLPGADTQLVAVEADLLQPVQQDLVR